MVMTLKSYLQTTDDGNLLIVANDVELPLRSFVAKTLIGFRSGILKVADLNYTEDFGRSIHNFFYFLLINPTLKIRRCTA